MDAILKVAPPLTMQSPSPVDQLIFHWVTGAVCLRETGSGSLPTFSEVNLAPFFVSATGTGLINNVNATFPQPSVPRVPDKKLQDASNEI